MKVVFREFCSLYTLKKNSHCHLLLQHFKTHKIATPTIMLIKLVNQGAHAVIPELDDSIVKRG